MTISLSGKTVLVTGASRGIGKAIALGMGSAGARVACHGFSNTVAATEVADACGNGSQAFVSDLSTAGGPGHLWSAVLEAFGRVDVLVNNAGIALEMKAEMPDGDWLRAWDQTMSVNVRAYEMLSRAAVSHFSTFGGGRMIHVASRAAFRGDTADFITYAASKGAVVAMSKSIARAFGKDDICSFVIAPGWVRTDMAGEMLEQYGEQHVIDALALNRLTEPEDLAPLVVLLGSGLADHATGTSIHVNAGSYVC